MQDIQRAIRLVRHDAIENKKELAKKDVIGFPAGGYLCANASINYEQPTNHIIDHADYLSCRPVSTLLIYGAYLDQGEKRSMSSELSVNKDVPPM